MALFYSLNTDLAVKLATSVFCLCDITCSPLEQFEVFVVLFFLITNSALFLTLPLGFVTFMYHMVYKQTTFL